MKSWFRTLAISAIAVCLAGAAPASGPAPAPGSASTFEGRWDGMIVVLPDEMEVDFYVVVERDKQGSLGGRVSFPTQGPTEYAFTRLVAEDDRIEFSNADQAGIVASYTGVLAPGGEMIAGDVTEQGVTKPFILRKSPARTAAADRRPELRILSSGGQEFKDRFNQDADAVRLLMILSPNCGLCRMGARMVERHILDKISDPDLRVYVVWEPVSSQDGEQAARDAVSLISGDRVTHFWSADRFTGKAFQNVATPQKDPLWDVFLVFAEGKRWGDSPPAPDLFMHNLREKEDLPKDQYLNSAKLAARVQDLLR